VTTVLKLTAAYAMLDNGGKRITPTLIDRIQDRQGRTIYTHDKRFCDGCWPEQYTSSEMPQLPDTRERIADRVSDYQIIHMMEGVVQRGTGRVVSEVGKPIAGKTGTSNDDFDAWFVGFAPNLAVGVFVGFDHPRTLGHGETGGRVAAPIFRDFMEAALKNQPPTPFRVPPGVRMVRVDLKSGLPTSAMDPHAIWQAFRATDTLPTANEPVLRGQGVQANFTFTPLANDNNSQANAAPGGDATAPDGSRVPPATVPPTETAQKAPPAVAPVRRMPVAGGVY
jgi:penicillin-binding protein 1A